MTEEEKGGAGLTLLRFQRHMSPTHTTAIPHVFCSERKEGCRSPWIRCRWPWIHSDRPWIRHRRLSMALDLPQSQSRQRLCVVPMDESVDRAEWMEEKESSGKGKGGRGADEPAGRPGPVTWDAAL